MARRTIQKQRRRQILQALHKRLLVKPFDKTSIIEIWEISIYNETVKEKLKDMYRTWITIFAGHLAELIEDHKKAHELSTLIVSFSEGLSLLSVMLEDLDLSFGTFGTLYQTFKKITLPLKKLE